MKFFEIGVCMYTKSMTLCATWRFNIKKSRHFEKKQDNLQYIFYIEKSWHFALRYFSWDFWNWRRGEGAFLYTKNNTFCVKFLYDKNNALSVMCLYTKSRHFASHFYVLKKMHFVLSLYIYNLLYIIFYYLIINIHTIRAIRSINKFELFNDNLSYYYNK